MQIMTSYANYARDWWINQRLFKEFFPNAATWKCYIKENSGFWKIIKDWFVQPNSKENQPWIFSGRTDAEAETPNILATWCGELTNWKRPWCWERLKVKGEGGGRGWDGYIELPTQWTSVLANSGRYWRTGKPGKLQSMRLQRVRQDLVTEQQNILLMADVSAKLINYILFSLIEKIVTDEKKKTVIDDLCLNK